MSNDDTTLVLGATGKTGRRVAARLRLHGTPVRAASRSSSTPFDWTDPSGWDAALQGVAAVYVVAPTTPGPVHEFVARAEAAVRGSALEWTVLRPTDFFQNFDEETHHAALVAGELALPAGTLTEAMIDIDDVADVAATVLTEPGKHAGQVYELTGPRALTYREAVDLISRATGQPITYTEVTTAEYAARLVAQGWGEDDAHHVAEMYVLIERGTLADTTDGVQTVLGRAPRTFEDYVVRTAAAGGWRS